MQDDGFHSFTPYDVFLEQICLFCCLIKNMEQGRIFSDAIGLFATSVFWLQYSYKHQIGKEGWAWDYNWSFVSVSFDPENICWEKISRRTLLFPWNRKMVWGLT